MRILGFYIPTAGPSRCTFRSGDDTTPGLTPDCLPHDIAPTSTRTSDAPRRARRARLFQGRSSARASHRQRRGCPPERSTICRHVVPCGSVPQCWFECRGVPGSACRYRCLQRRNTGSARSTRAAPARAIASAGSAPASWFRRNQTAPRPVKAPKAAAYLTRRGRSKRGRTSPSQALADPPRSAANQTRIEQRFFGRWIKGPDNPLFARARTDRCGKACARQLPEPLLRLCDLRTMLRVEHVARVTGTIHHDLDCHFTHSNLLPEAGLAAPASIDCRRISSPCLS